MPRALNLTTDERIELFGDFAHDARAAEAEERWGDTHAWAESARRTSSYTKEDWQRYKSEASALTARLADAMNADVPADGDLAMDLAEEHRTHISRWFYDCTYDIHRGLADLYVSAPRFTATFDRTSPGLATYLRTAILANATRQN
ncbi:TipAS antibiotic-recognition domain-containing protein [Nonomuraea sp. NPDC052265]|uniref:TipAS antibiotic-recognition domain-containing protein n=1 Tax=Nonomuraea sp. NPDC052265 TaxID=3364374 RepID=UPI0037C8AE3E